MNSDFVGRNSSGVPTSGQALGTAAIPWGTLRTTSLIVNGTVIDSDLSAAPQNRVISGAVRSTSSHPAYIQPSASLAFTVLGSTTNLLINVNGTSVSVATNILKTGITAGPSATHTCLVNDTDAADQAATKIWGEYEVRKEIAVDTMGATMEAKVGQWIAFSIAGVGTEYAMGFLESSLKISRVKRGHFMNSSLAPVNRTGYSNNDTITLLGLGWVFMDDDATTVDVSYNNPVWSYTQPSSPATGDYWFDLANQTWKRYDGAAFQIIGRTFIGTIAVTDTAVVGARAEDFYVSTSNNINTIDLEVQTTEIVRARNPFGKIFVAGTLLDFGNHIPTWNITTQLATSADMYSATEQASTNYYLYISKTGQALISDIEPYFRTEWDGWYHPHNTWRAVGICFNNGSSNIVGAESYAYSTGSFWFTAGNGHGSTNDKIRRWTNVTKREGASALLNQSSTLGDDFEIMIPGNYTVITSDDAASSEQTGISLNSTQLTTAISSVSESAILTYNGNTAGNMSGAYTGYFKRGDKIRQHTAGTNNDTGAATSYFKLMRNN